MQITRNQDVVLHEPHEVDGRKAVKQAASKSTLIASYHAQSGRGRSPGCG